MRKVILALVMLCVPAQSGCAVMDRLLAFFASDPELDQKIEQDKLEAELIKEYGR